MTEALVTFDNVVHVYGSLGQEVTALRGVDLQVNEGEMIALLGPSGAGKSTLLWLCAGLLKPTAGRVDVCGRQLAKLTPSLIADMRLRDVGVILQNPARNLLQYETALGNVMIPQRPARGRRKVKYQRAKELLEAVGLAAVSNRVAGRLSGGEQQRLAVATALANGPRLLLADEPTSQLDYDSADAVIGLIRTANADLGTAVIAVTHDPAVGAALGRTVTIRDGRVGSEGHAGEDYLVVGRDGSVQLPQELLDTVLPPGSLARAIPTKTGAELRRVHVTGGGDAQR